MFNLVVKIKATMGLKKEFCHSCVVRFFFPPMFVLPQRETKKQDDNESQINIFFLSQFHSKNKSLLLLLSDLTKKRGGNPINET